MKETAEKAMENCENMFKDIAMRYEQGKLKKVELKPEKKNFMKQHAKLGKPAAPIQKRPASDVSKRPNTCEEEPTHVGKRPAAHVSKRPAAHVSKRPAAGGEEGMDKAAASKEGKGKEGKGEPTCSKAVARTGPGHGEGLSGEGGGDDGDDALQHDPTEEEMASSAEEVVDSSAAAADEEEEEEPIVTHNSPDPMDV